MLTTECFFVAASVCNGVCVCDCVYEPEETKACCWSGAECLSRVCIQLARSIFSTFFLKMGSNVVTQIVQVQLVIKQIYLLENIVDVKVLSHRLYNV